MPLRSASTISPVISIFSSFCAMVASFRPVEVTEADTDASASRSRDLRDQADVRGLRALLALLLFVLDLRALGKRPVAAALDRAEVHEQVLVTLVGGDEPVALVRVEPLDGSGCHISFTSLPLHERARRVQPAPIQTRSNCPGSVAPRRLDRGLGQPRTRFGARLVSGADSC